jgi:hypothetical protein
MMRSTVFATSVTLLLWAAPAFAADFDADGVEDAFDNCSERANPTQVDTDGDFCGNVCDADYSNSGVTGIADFGEWYAALGTTDEAKIHRDPSAGETVGYRDYGFWVTGFGFPAGPSGTTPGTVACPQ